MKLRKVKSSEWNGNGFGHSAAIWIVDGTDIQIIQLSTTWYAIQNNQKISRGFSKKDLLENLEFKLSECI